MAAIRAPPGGKTDASVTRGHGRWSMTSRSGGDTSDTSDAGDAGGERGARTRRADWTQRPENTSGAVITAARWRGVGEGGCVCFIVSCWEFHILATFYVMRRREGGVLNCYG